MQGLETHILQLAVENESLYTALCRLGLALSGDDQKHQRHSRAKTLQAVNVLREQLDRLVADFALEEKDPQLI